MIEFINVSKSFWTGERRKVILDRASFQVRLGQSMGILAPNGTGKSTLINMMAGIEKPDEGKIIRTSRVSFPMGFSGGLAAKQSAAENARYIARVYSLDPDYVEAFCRYMTDIEEYFDQPINTYSRGMSARFDMALLLALDFDIYLIDEGLPSAVDVEFNKRAGAALHERLQSGTLVIVSHDPAILDQYCTSAAVLKDGRLHFFDSLNEAKRLYLYDAA